MTGSMQRAHRERKGLVWNEARFHGRGVMVNSGAKTKNGEVSKGSKFTGK